MPRWEPMQPAVTTTARQKGRIPALDGPILAASPNAIQLLREERNPFCFWRLRVPLRNPRPPAMMLLEDDISKGGQGWSPFYPSCGRSGKTWRSSWTERRWSRCAGTWTTPGAIAGSIPTRRCICSFSRS